MSQKLKKIMALVLTMSIIVGVAPDLAKKAVAATWKVIVNPETPMDRVYFYKEGKYIYGYRDGKVTICDFNLKLVKKTAFTGISLIGSNVDQKYYYVVDKKEGKENKQGVIDERGNTVFPAENVNASVNYTTDCNSDKPVYYFLMSKKDSATLYDCNKKKVVDIALKNVYIVGYNNSQFYIAGIDADGHGCLLLNDKVIYKSENNVTGFYGYVNKYNGSVYLRCSIYSSDSSKSENINFDLDGNVIPSAIKINKVQEQRLSSGMKLRDNVKIEDQMTCGEYSFEKVKNEGYYTAKKGGEIIGTKVYINNCWSDFGSHKYEQLIRVINEANKEKLKDFVYDVVEKKIVYQTKKPSEKLDYYYNITKNCSITNVTTKEQDDNNLILSTTSYILGEKGKVLYSQKIPYIKEKKDGNTYSKPKYKSFQTIVNEKKKRIYIFEGVQRKKMGDTTYMLVGKGIKVESVSTKKSSIIIPEKVALNAEKYPVKYIGKNAFSSCKKLKKITIKSKEIIKVNKTALKGTKKGLVIKVPKKVKKKYEKLFKKAGNSSVKVK